MEEKRRLLYVEDEQDLGNVVKQYLEIMGFDVCWITTATSAWDYFQKENNFDLIIIDVQLPDYNGFQLAKKIMSCKPDQPFLFLTARNEKKDKIEGLNIGADDYILKPFDVDELVLRIKNILKRISAPAHPVISSILQTATLPIGDLIVNKDTHKLSFPDGTIVDITLREIEVLEYLNQNTGHLLSRKDILVNIWGDDDYFMGRSLDVFISRIRKILKKSSKVKIETVYGSGFIFRVS
ncbi:response regulator transcription factor [Sphingobacterium hungaricum]|uniref:DNA-binding response regulator n=1 Tax=Sphingobacterium hungaricum TaxID=2082723 RepID=A0A928UW57_9SPHI|nr:response regulator transcription factor [Sphingobacterium hungaricum]MBE8714421.1 DNA-binding response regulator [Sphingobacterium hungaricum]